MESKYKLGMRTHWGIMQKNTCDRKQFLGFGDRKRACYTLEQWCRTASSIGLIVDRTVLAGETVGAVVSGPLSGKVLRTYQVCEEVVL